MTVEMKFSDFCDLFEVPKEHQRGATRIDQLKDLGIDSLTIMDAIMLVEDRLNIIIPDKVQDTFETLGDAYETACKFAKIEPNYEN